MNALPGDHKSSLQLQKNAAAPVLDALVSVYGTGFSGRDPPVIVGEPKQCGPVVQRQVYCFYHTKGTSRQ